MSFVLGQYFGNVMMVFTPEMSPKTLI